MPEGVRAHPEGGIPQGIPAGIALRPLPSSGHLKRCRAPRPSPSTPLRASPGDRAPRAAHTQGAPEGVRAAHTQGASEGMPEGVMAHRASSRFALRRGHPAGDPGGDGREILGAPVIPTNEAARGASACRGPGCLLPDSTHRAPIDSAGAPPRQAGRVDASRGLISDRTWLV